MHINISGLRFWDGHHCYGLTQATVAVISKPTVFPPSTMCSPLSPSGEWIDCKVICWLRGRAPHSVTLQLKWFYGFWVCAKVKTSSLCILGHTRFSYVTLFHSARFYSTGHQELNMPSRLWLSSFLGIGIPQSFILYPPDRVGCVAVTNGPTIYLSGLLYKEIFFSCILSLNPHEPQLNSPARYSRGGKTNMVNHILSSRAPTQMWHIYSQ